MTTSPHVRYLAAVFPPGRVANGRDALYVAGEGLSGVLYLTPDKARAFRFHSQRAAWIAARDMAQSSKKAYRIQRVVEPQGATGEQDDDKA